jgi:hypothetical protein
LRIAGGPNSDLALGARAHGADGSQKRAIVHEPSRLGISLHDNPKTFQVNAFISSSA